MKEAIYIFGWLLTAGAVIGGWYLLSWLFHFFRKARKRAGKEPYFVFLVGGDEPIYILGADIKGAKRVCEVHPKATFNYYVNNEPVFAEFKPVSICHIRKVALFYST